MDNLYDVIVVGAGPVGLLLACELGLAGSSVLVLEKNEEAHSQWKVFPLGLRGLNTPSIEALYRRGLLDKLFDSSTEAPAPKISNHLTGVRNFVGHFAGIMLDGDKLEMDRWKYTIPGPGMKPRGTTMDQMESTLIKRAESLGVQILRGHAVSKIVSQEDNTVSVEAGENRTFSGRWLVGCDGGRSAVRHAAGFEFMGTEPKYTGYSAKLELDHPEKLPRGGRGQATKNGMFIFMKPNCLHLLDFLGPAFDRAQDITKEHLQEVLDRLIGTTDIHITTLHMASSSTDRCKQATTYRKGRILLAGDAAHIHSPLGGQGMNLGLGDAMNLGWKLAATIRQETASNGSEVDLRLLDTYESERHSVAAWALEWTRAQVATLMPDLYGEAIRKLIVELLDTTDGTNLLVDKVWGLSRRYDLGDSHPLVGASAPDFKLDDGSRLGPKLESGHGLLVDFGGHEALRTIIDGEKYSVVVDYLNVSAEDTRGLSALLIRPDGIVAWALEAEQEPDMNAAKGALGQWFDC